MAEVEIPVVGGEVDTSDPSGSAMSFALAVVAVTLLLAAISLGQRGWNWIANNTPDVLQPVEVA